MMEIEFGKLVPNKYNPRRTMSRRQLASLTRSLERDGQLQTMLVRPTEGGKFEVVAGMRRYRAFENSLGPRDKVLCTVLDMDEPTAMRRAYKENVEREALSAMDEARWFFAMLGLKDEQLWQVDKPGPKSTPEGRIGLPTDDSVEAKGLASDLDVSADRIADRVPLLALPDELQEKIQEDGEGLTITKAEQLARLRLLGNKKDAQTQMLATWTAWGEKSLDDLTKQVTAIIETRTRKAEETLKQLERITKKVAEEKKDLDDVLEQAREWLDPKDKDSLFGILPKDVRTTIAEEIPSLPAQFKTVDEYQEAYDAMEEFVMVLTKDDTLEKKGRQLRNRQTHLEMGLRDLTDEDHGTSCTYCGSPVQGQDIQGLMKRISGEVKDIEEETRLKDGVRDRTEKLKRDVGYAVSDYKRAQLSFREAIKQLMASEIISRDEGEKRLREVLGMGKEE